MTDTDNLRVYHGGGTELDDRDRASDCGPGRADPTGGP